MPTPESSAAARKLGEFRPTTIITCEICGKERRVLARKLNQGRTCSTAHRVALWRRNLQEPEEARSAPAQTTVTTTTDERPGARRRSGASG